MNEARRRTLLLLAKRPAAALRDQIAAGEEPRVEYLELADRLGAPIVHFGDVERSQDWLVRIVTRTLGLSWGLAVQGALRHDEFDDIYATGEDVGLPLAVILRAMRVREKLTMLAHNVDTRKRRALLRILGHRAFRYVLCLGSEQERVLTSKAGLPPEKVKRLNYWLDHEFFRPEATSPEDLILSVGMASRDYATLQEAAKSLPYEFHVVASGWSPDGGFTPALGISSGTNVTVERGVSAARLRELYARARLVVVPLHRTSSTAGVTSLLEAMAMGKAVITTDSPGIRDYVVSGVSSESVPAGDIASLRSAIEKLWTDRSVRTTIEEHNRRWVDDVLNMDRYVDSVERLLMKPESSNGASHTAATVLPLTVEVVTTAEELEQLESEWTALFTRIPDALPFARHEWASAWWTHLRRHSRFVRDALRVFVVRDATGAAVAFAPFMRTEYQLLGLPLIRILQPIGTDPNITEVRGVLVAPEREVQVLQALAAHIRADSSRVDWVRWSGLRCGESVTSALSLHEEDVVEQIPMFLLSLPDSWDDFRRTRPRNVRESLRKCYNSLSRDGHEWHFHALETPEDIRSALDRFLELHGNRAHLEAGVRHRDCFSSAPARAFIADVLQRLARHGAVRLFQLTIGETVVAARLGFVCGDQMYLYYSGFDPAWGRYSVMTTVVAESLRYAIEQRIPVVNLSTGEDVSKTRWRPDAVQLTSVLTVAEGVRSHLAHRLFTASFRALRESRKRPVKPAADSVVP